MNRRLLRVTFLVLLILAVEGALVTAALLSPSFQKEVGNLGAQAVSALQDAWIGTDETPGMAPVLRKGFEETWRKSLRPLWAAPQHTESTASPFAACASCHPDFSSLVRVNDLYVDHQSHAALGMSCEDCHKDIAHPDPLPPSERICEECHTDVATGGDCSLCHVPASLPHYSELGAPRNGVISCSSCHLPGSLTKSTPEHLADLGHFDGADYAVCSSCHKKRTCDGCHEPGHPSDWIDEHPNNVIGNLNRTTCTRCHTLVWCADACHGTQSTLRQLPIDEMTTGENR